MKLSNQRLRPVILCGGAGSRLWPLSRSESPKPFVDLIGPQSLFELTLRRIQDSNLFDEPIIVCNQAQEALVRECCAKIKQPIKTLILEPVGRNTLAAISLAALSCDVNDQMLVMPADHVIDDLAHFREDCKKASKCVSEGYACTFAIKPNRIETGYGYLQKGTALKDSEGYAVKQFCEKPDQKTAAGFVESGDYYWNSGLFVFAVKHFLDLASCFQADSLEQVKQAYSSAVIVSNTLKIKRDAFELVESISVDYAIMEKTDKAALVLAGFDWDDLGDWRALWRYKAQKNKTLNEKTNIAEGSVLFHQAHGNFVKSDRTKVVLAGVDNLAVVETGDAVLVTKKDQGQLLKEAVMKLEAQSDVRLHTPTKAIRPWGSFESLHKKPGYQVKELVVNPGGILSLQRHQHRCEQWFVIEGIARVTLGEDIKELKTTDSIFIPQGAIHRLENASDQPLKVIEVQFGSYLGEDDIERLEDVYSREP